MTSSFWVRLDETSARAQHGIEYLIISIWHRVLVVVIQPQKVDALVAHGLHDRVGRLGSHIFTQMGDHSERFSGCYS